jgi:predicted membrane-bound spermidine synthase
MKLNFSILISIFLISLTGLMFEILLTRIFSTLLWYHFTFVAISSALLGWGLGAYVLTFLKKKYELFFPLSVLFSLSIIFFLCIVTKFPANFLILPYLFVVSLIPFLFGGMNLSLAFHLYTKFSGKLYFADLIGASLGALSVPFLLNFINPESLVLLVSMIPLFSSLIFLGLKSKKTILIYVLFFSVAGLFLLNVLFNFISLKPGPTKALYQHLDQDKNLHIVKTKWNSFSRVDLVEGYQNFLGNIYIDTFAWTYVIPWNENRMNYVKDWFRYIPFHVKPASKVLIIGSGGGTDVALALVSGSKDITAIEINPTIIEYVKEYGKRDGDVYNNKYVKVINDEGRNYVSRSNEKFDLIELGFVDSSSAIVSGGLVISENYLYTVEAFKDYFEHLKDDGILAFVRYEVDIPRLLTISRDALKEIGVKENLDKHILVISQIDIAQKEPFLGNQMVFIIKKSPFELEEIKKIKLVIGNKWEFVIMPYNDIKEPYNQFLSNKMSLSDFESKFDVNVFPVYDNNPFYFAYYKPIGIPLIFLQTLSIPFLFSLLLFCFLWILKRKENTLTKINLIYFSSLGVGFMLLEIPILQKFILLLGRPIFTFSVILFSLLLSTSIGSLASSFVKNKKIPKLIIFSSLAVIIIAIIYLLSLNQIIRYLLPFSLEKRILSTFILLFPLGFFMGIPFPSGIRLLKTEKNQVPIVWGINGITSVFGSVLATVFGVAVGFNLALIISLFAYGLVILSTIIKSSKS